jgi:branched-chain amino acid transport system substrate-binding protein
LDLRNNFTSGSASRAAETPSRASYVKWICSTRQDFSRQSF